MPPTDVKAAVQGRMRILLLALGIVGAAGLIYGIWPAAEPKAQPSNQARDVKNAQSANGAHGSLEVRLNDLKQPPPGPGDTTRNPFRFYVKPPPPPKPVEPAVPRVPKIGDRDYKPPLPPPPPPITIKCIGTAEQGTMKVAIFSDGKGLPVYASEGQTVLGQYKLLKIGVESVTMSYLDGTGKQTIPIRGG